MLAALIFVISVAAAIQFGVFSWRAGLLSFTSEPLSEAMKPVTQFIADPQNPKDFHVFALLQELCPELHPSERRELWTVRLYYRTVSYLGSKLGAAAPAWRAWSHREMVACTRYVAVLMDQRLQRNLSCLAEIRSF